MGLFGVSLGGKYDFVVCMCYQSGCLGKDFLTIKFTVKRPASYNIHSIWSQKNMLFAQFCLTKTVYIERDK